MRLSASWRKSSVNCTIRTHPEAARTALRQLVCERLPESLGADPRSDIQVLTPMHRGPLGTQALNEALQDWLNPTGARKVHSLVDKVYKRKNLELAWERVRQNGGAGGVDRQSIAEFKEGVEQHLSRLHEELKTNTYQPQPVPQRLIPKAGQSGKTHGRVTAGSIKSANGSMTTINTLAWGRGKFTSTSNMGAVALATSLKYEVPPVIQALALDNPDEYLNYERHSFNIEDASHYGMDLNNINDIPRFWGMGAFTVPDVITQTIATADTWDLWLYPDFKDLKDVASTLAIQRR